jgi:hypothetical protein
MRRRCVLLVLSMLAGCASDASGDSPEAVCRRQAYDDPTVKQLTIANLSPASPNPDAKFEYSEALRNATDACLRQKGVHVQGGVEPVQSR